MPRFSSIFHYGPHIFTAKFRILFLAKIFHASGIQLTLFFLPLFLYQVGSDWQLLQELGLTSFQQGMLTIGGYFLLQRLWVLIWSIPSSQIISRIGVRNGMIVGQVLYILTLGLFAIIPQAPVLLFITAFMEALKVCFFWNSYYSLLSKTAVYSNMGQSVGTIELFSKLLHVVIPAVSALLIIHYGFPAVFIVSMVFHIVSVIILFFFQPAVHLTAGTWKEFVKWWREKSFRLLSFAEAGHYILTSQQLLWPFFVLLLIGSIDTVGFLYSLIFFLSLLITYFSGWYVDHSRNRRPLLFSGMVMSSLWVVRMFVSTIWSVILVDTIDKLANSVFVPFFESIFLRRGKGNSALAYFSYREVVLSFMAVVFWSLFISYFMIFESWRGFLLLGVIGSLAGIQMRDRKKHS